jgi:superfamily II DNA or RNA helicase
LKFRLQQSFMHVVPETALKHPERKRSMVFMNEDAASFEQKTWERKHLDKINFSDIDEEMSDGDLARFRRELGINKVPWIARYAKERATSGEALLVFAWHREVVMRLHRLLKWPFVMGGTTDEEREAAFGSFQAGRVQGLILNIASAGRGHNLQRANRVIFGEFSWTDELNIQCEKRASRKGNEQEFTLCDYIVAPNTMDEPVLNSVFTKARNKRRIIG